MKTLILIVMLIVLNTITALGVVYNQYQKRILGMQFSLMEAHRDQMMDKWAQLLIERATWSSNARIEKVASEQLGMRHQYSNHVFLGM